MSPSSHHRVLGRLLFAIAAGAAASACGAKTTPTTDPSDESESDVQTSAAGSASSLSLPGEEEPATAPASTAPQCSFGPASTFCLGVSSMRQMARYGAGQVQRDPPRTDAG